MQSRAFARLAAGKRWRDGVFNRPSVVEDITTPWPLRLTLRKLALPKPVDGGGLL